MPLDGFVQSDLEELSKRFEEINDEMTQRFQKPLMPVHWDWDLENLFDDDDFLIF